jgi:hypothetical protein
MEKTFSKIEISVIKSTAKNVDKYVAMKQKVEAQINDVEKKVAEAIRKRVAEKIKKLEAEKAGYQTIIDSMNAPVKQITGGYTTEDLVDIKKEATGSMDPKTGKEIMKTVYVLKYPDTVVPPTTEEAAGSDYDKDAEEYLQSQEAAPEEAPEEMVAEGDPFAGVEADPFNQ